MTTISLSAIYRNGRLELSEPLDLPDGTEVLVQVTLLDLATPNPSFAFGAFPELADITDEELEDVKKVWDRMVERQIRIITGLE
jgi:hypothetical protein